MQRGQQRKQRTSGGSTGKKKYITPATTQPSWPLNTGECNDPVHFCFRVTSGSFTPRGTGGGRLCGLRGRILALVGRSSAVGVCEGFFEEDSSLLPSAQSLDGHASSLQLTPTTAVQPVTAPADPATPRLRRFPSRVSVGDRPGTSGLSRTSQQQERCTPSRRPAAEDFLPEIVAGYQKSLDVAAEIKSELQQLKDEVGAVATSFQREAETMLGQSATLNRLAAATEALADSQARQATALERMAAIQENRLANESANQARIVAAVERLAITGQFILQQVQWLSTVTPISGEPPAK
ncbi:uncharacterized protein LOC144134886 [Amblyomma americanum]